MIPLLLLACSQFQVDGLKPEESFVELAPAISISDDIDPGFPVYAGGRVIDAFTGQPVWGATIEIWSEEIDEVHGGFYRFGEATTGVDGCFRVRNRFGGETGEKGRIRAPGYLTLSAPAGDMLWGTTTLFPAPDSKFAKKRVLQIQFLDAQGRPIPDAIVTSTYSCSHDAPAFEAHADGSGIVSLPEFGLQDNVQDLRFRAPGYASIEYLYGKPAFNHAGHSHPFKVYRPRLQSSHLRLLDMDGDRGLELKPIHIHDGEGFHVERTDKFGRLHIHWPYQNRYLSFTVLGQKTFNYFGDPELPFGRSFNLRQMPGDWSENTPTGTLVIELPDLGEDFELRDQLFHEDGWLGGLPRKDSWDYGLRDDEPSKVRVEFPAGEGFLLLGGAFSGVRQTILEFGLEAEEEVQLKPEIQREALVKILLPEDSYPEWLQAGETSLVAKSDFSDMEDDGLWVPPETDLYIQIAYQNSRKVHALGQATDGQVFDLRDAVLAQVPSPPPVASLFVKVPAALVEDGSLSVKGASEEITLVEDAELLEGTFQFHGPAGSAFLGSFKADGHVRAWFRGHLPLPEKDGSEGLPASINLKPVRFASLELQSEAEFSVQEPPDLDFEELHPGPLNLIVEFEDGRRVGISMELTAGEKRVLRIEP